MMEDVQAVVAGLKPITKALPKGTDTVHFNNGTHDLAWVSFGGSSVVAKVDAKKTEVVYYGLTVLDVPEGATHMSILGSKDDQGLVCHCFAPEEDPGE